MDLLEKEWFIEAPWGRLSIVAWGHCMNPPVLMLHGEADNAAVLRPLIKMLPDNFYYIGLEFPGCGRSDPYPPGLMINLLDMIYPVEVVRKHFRWEQFVLLAHSIASTIGRFYNLTYPGKISKLIELDQITPSLTVTPENFPNWYDKFFTQYFNKYDQLNGFKETAPTYTWQEAVNRLSKRGLSADVVAQFLERTTESAGNGRIRFTFDQRTKLLTRPPVSKQQIKQLYTSMSTPTLAVIANGSVAKGHYGNTPFLLEEEAFNGNYIVVRVEGDHDVHITNPERVAPSVAQFILHGVQGVRFNAKL